MDVELKKKKEKRKTVSKLNFAFDFLGLPASLNSSLNGRLKEAVLHGAIRSSLDIVKKERESSGGNDDEERKISDMVLGFCGDWMDSVTRLKYETGEFSLSARCSMETTKEIAFESAETENAEKEWDLNKRTRMSVSRHVSLELKRCEKLEKRKRAISEKNSKTQQKSLGGINLLMNKKLFYSPSLLELEKKKKRKKVATEKKRGKKRKRFDLEYDEDKEEKEEEEGLSERRNKLRRLTRDNNDNDNNNNNEQWEQQQDSTSDESCRSSSSSSFTEEEDDDAEKIMNLESGTLNTNELTGDERLDLFRELLDMYDWEREDNQIQFHEIMLKTVLPKIFNKEWDTDYERILRMFKMEKHHAESFIICPRRYGKTVSVAMFCAAYMFMVPNATIAIFSTAKRTAGKMMTAIYALMRQLPFFDQVFFKTNNCECIELYLHGNKREMWCYPGTVAVR